MCVCVCGILSLTIVEVSGHCDHRFLHGVAQTSLRGRLHLSEHQGGDLFREILNHLTSDIDLPERERDR